MITEKLCKKAGIKEISKSKSRLVSYQKDEVKTIGRTHAIFEYRKKYHDTLVHVVDYDVVPVHITNLFGYESCQTRTCGG